MPLDAADLVLEALVEGQDVLRGDAHGVALELDGVQHRGVVREEDLSLAGAAHQLHLLTGRVAHDPAGESGALVAEVDLALVEHHAALPGEHGLALRPEVDADQLLVLLRPALPGRGLPELLERRGHTDALRRSLGHALRCALGRLLAVARRGRRLSVARGRGRLAVAGRRGRLPVSRRRGRSLGGLGLAVAGGRRSGLAGDLAVRRLLTWLAVRRGRRGGGRHRGTAGRRVHGRDDGLRGMHVRAGRRCGGRWRRGGGRRSEALRGGLRHGSRGGRAEGGRRRGLGGRGEARGGAGLRLLGLLRGGRLVLGHLTAEVPQQRVETAVEALSHGGEPPHVLEVEVAQHHGALGGELGAAERVPGHLLAARDDPDVPGTHLRHLSRAVDRRGEGQLLDLLRDPGPG
ncbi:hypothetical protein SVIOM342S_07108 [Streptomyces violaceorubidus]